MELLDLVGRALEYVRGSPGEGEAWAESEGAFLEHFGRTFEEFEVKLAEADHETVLIYARTFGGQPRSGGPVDARDLKILRRGKQSRSRNSKQDGEKSDEKTPDMENLAQEVEA